MSADRSSPVFDTVAIVGVGLIGGSLGMAARRRGLARRVIGIGRTEQKLMRAKILGAVDEYSLDMERGAQEADLLILCLPVRLIVPTLERMAPHLKQGAVVTDVGSTKLEIVTRASELMPDGTAFIGGHPMAGTEEAGVEAAFPDLFLGATYVLTPSPSSDLRTLGTMAEFVEGLGANVIEMAPDDHDRAAAAISHLPHALSAALLATSEDYQRELGIVFRLAAGSFRDLTRVSSSPPDLWRDICLTNRESLREAIKRFHGRLEELDRALSDGDEQAVEEFFSRARDIRAAYLRLSK